MVADQLLQSGDDILIRHFAGLTQSPKCQIPNLNPAQGAFDLVDGKQVPRRLNRGNVVVVGPIGEPGSSQGSQAPLLHQVRDSQSHLFALFKDQQQGGGHKGGPPCGSTGVRPVIVVGPTSIGTLILPEDDDQVFTQFSETLATLFPESWFRLSESTGDCFEDVDISPKIVRIPVVDPLATPLDTDVVESSLERLLPFFGEHVAQVHQRDAGDPGTGNLKSVVLLRYHPIFVVRRGGKAPVAEGSVLFLLGQEINKGLVQTSSGRNPPVIL